MQSNYWGPCYRLDWRKRATYAAWYQLLIKIYINRNFVYIDHNPVVPLAADHAYSISPRKFIVSNCSTLNAYTKVSWNCRRYPKTTLPIFHIFQYTQSFHILYISTKICDSGHQSNTINFFGSSRTKTDC